MFCDLVGSTAISAQLDAEEWRDLVGAYLDAASAAITELGQGITASDSKESQKQFARKPQHRHSIPAKTITCKGAITHLLQRLGNTLRETNAGCWDGD
jgi:hypothetical protein